MDENLDGQKTVENLETIFRKNIQLEQSKPF